MDKLKILVVDDESRMRKLVKDFLVKAGYDVIEAGDGEQAVDTFYAQKDIALIILDVMMPKMDGWQVCREIRQNSKVPIIMLTAKGEPTDKVTGLEMGADDYIAKPFRPRELVSRIRSVLRRYGKEKTLVPLGGVMVDTEKGRVTRDGRDVYLSALEYRLLLVFLSHRGKVLSRSQLLEEIWDAAGDFVNDNTLTVYIKRLREKIETDPADPQIIRTVRGIGYMVDA